MDKKVVFMSIPEGKDEDSAILERRLQIAKRDYLVKTKQDIRNVAFMYRDIGANKMQIPNDTNSAAIYLSKAIDQIARCDEVAFGKGWQNDNGCMIEMIVCLSFEIPHIEV